MTPDQEKVCSIITDAVLLLCRRGLVYECQIKLQGLLAVTIDSKNFFVVQIDEEVEKERSRDNISEFSASEKQLNEKSFEIKCEMNANENDICHNQPVNVINSKTFRRRENGQDGRLSVDQLDRLMAPSSAVRVKTEDNVIVAGSSRSSVVDELGFNCGYSVPVCDENMLVTTFCDSNKRGNFATQELPTREFAYDRLADRESFASDCEAAEFEDVQRMEFKNDAETLCHPMHLAVDNDWSGVSEKITPGRQPTTQPHDPPPVRRYASKNRSTSNRHQCTSVSAAATAIFKPFPCRFPGCQKRFCHETHARRHEREAHRYYRQRPRLYKLHPPETHDVICHQQLA